MFVQALSALISVCVGVYVFVMERKELQKESEPEKGGEFTKCMYSVCVYIREISVLW